MRLPFHPILALLLGGTLFAEASPTSSGGGATLLPDDSLASGGRVSGGNVTAEISVGGAIGGSVSNVTTNGVQSRGGFTGQLYDAVGLELSADPSTTVNEGESVVLLSTVTMDDGTTLADAATWSIVDGPLATVEGGIATARPTPVSATAHVEGAYDLLTEQLALTVLPLPYAPRPLSWDPSGDQPYHIFLGTDLGSLSEVGTSNIPRFNPGQLEMGTTYYWQILDDMGTDITPGGAGPQSFTTAVYQPDTRVGRGALPETHIGDDVHNLTGAGQLVGLKLKGTKPGRFFFSVENDGDEEDSHLFRGTRASSKMKFVNYYRLTPTRENVTAAAVAGGYRAGETTPGETINFEVQARSKGKKKVNQLLLLSARSEEDERGEDVGAGRIVAKPKKKKKKK